MRFLRPDGAGTCDFGCDRRGYRWQDGQQAVDVVKQAAGQFGPIHRLVEHSLGGGLASAAALVYNMPATTFNAAGVNRAFLGHYGRDLTLANELIQAYRVKGEILSTLQDASLGSFLFSPIVGLAGILAPNAVGRAYWLPGNSLSFIARHDMGEVFAGLRTMM